MQVIRREEEREEAPTDFSYRSLHSLPDKFPLTNDVIY